MASNEWASEHRELQFLRAASREGRGSPAKRRRRRLYADVRWRKLQAVNPRFRNKLRAGKPPRRPIDNPELR
jgi:hypothetical protein